VFKFNDWDHKTWRLVIPIVATNITIPLLGIVDTAVVGHLPGPHYLGGVAIGSLVFSIIFSSMMFLRMGTTGLTAQSLGAQDDDEVRAWLIRGVLIALVIGIFLIFMQIPIGLCGIPGYRARIRPIVSRITIHWPSFYNVVTGKTLALPNLIALQHIPLSPAGVIAKRPAPIALPNSCAAEWRMAPDAVFSPYASVRYFTPHMVHSQYNLL